MTPVCWDTPCLILIPVPASDLPAPPNPTAVGPLLIVSSSQVQAESGSKTQRRGSYPLTLLGNPLPDLSCLASKMGLITTSSLCGFVCVCVCVCMITK